MNVLWLNSRTEMHAIDLDEVAFMQADGHYTDISFANGNKRSELIGITMLESAIKELYGGDDSPFCRIGRSFLININHVVSIHLQKHVISFISPKVQTLTLSRQSVCQLKSLILSRKKAVGLSSLESSS